MVTKYGDFIGESASALPPHLQQMTLEESAAYIKANCTTWIANNRTRLYRGYRVVELYNVPSGTILLADTTLKEEPRRPMYPSKAFYNFVTSSPNWRSLPNRAWSSFSTNEYAATTRFAKKSDTYVVVPVDNAAFGHCPVDFNFAVTVSPLELSGHGAIMRVYNICETALTMQEVKTVKPFTDITYMALKKKCAEASDAIKSAPETFVDKYVAANGADSPYYKGLRRTLVNMLEKKSWDIMAMLEELLRPANMLCSSVNYEELIGKINAEPSKAHEVWTTDKQLLLPGGTVNQVLQML